MISDIVTQGRYAALMVEGRSFIEIQIDTKEPIELFDFIGAFSSIGSEYDRYIKQVMPEVAHEATMFVKQVREGSIIAHLIPVVMPILSTMDAILIVDNFVHRYGGLINPDSG